MKIILPNKIMLILSPILFLALFCPRISAKEPDLRPLEPIVAEHIKNTKKDPSELAYISARGAALYTALSGYIYKNPRNENDKKLSDDLFNKALIYSESSTICGLISKKTEEATLNQIKILVQTYGEMIIASKQLNNQVISPAISADMNALTLIEPTIVSIVLDSGKNEKSKSK